jgi:cell division transport system permease protein
MNTHFKTASRILRLSAAAFLCASFIFAANRYYEVKASCENLFSKIQITVFFDKQNRDCDKTVREIESLGLINLSEYVPSQQAYSKAAEKNPFLKEVSVPQDANYFASYAVFTPADIPTDDYLTLSRAAVMQIDGVDEIVFNQDICRQYVETENALLFYKSAGAVFAVIIFTFFLLQCVLRILNRGEHTKKAAVKRLAVEVAAYLISSALGFVILWGVCQFVQYPLLINEAAAFIIIPLVCVLGIIFNGNRNNDND